MINAQAYHDTSLSNLLLTEKCSTGLSVNLFFTDGWTVSTSAKYLVTGNTDTNFLSNATGNGDRKCIWQKDSVCVTGTFLSTTETKSELILQ